MMHVRNNGKKLMAVRIIKHAMEIIHLLTDANPIQIIVDAVINRIGSAGVVRRQAVDISPLRRVNQAIYLLTTGARESAFRNVKTIAECLADELINAAKGSSNSYHAHLLVSYHHKDFGRVTTKLFMKNQQVLTRIHLGKENNTVLYSAH
ncbi:40S ribosomal protein S5-like protein [Tanacetum coccineum]